MIEFIGAVISLLALFYLFILQYSTGQQKGGGERSPPRLQKQREELSFDSFFNELVKEEGKRQIKGRIAADASKAKQQQLPLVPVKKVPYGGEKRSSLKDYQLVSPLEERHIKGRLQAQQTHSSEKIENRSRASLQSLNLNEKTGVSRGSKVLNQLKNRRDLVIYHEIIGSPRGNIF